MSWDFKRFLGEIDFLGALLSNRMDKIKNDINLGPLVKPLDPDAARRMLLEYLGQGDYKAIGIDGSMSYEERMEIVVLYVAVSGYSTTLSIDNSGNIEVDWGKIEREDKYTFSTVIPVWIEDINDILKLSDVGGLRSLETSMESIPFSVMTFGEYYQGMKAAEGYTKIIFLDRPIGSSIHPYRRDARKLIFREKGGALLNYNLNGDVLTLTDIFLGAYIGPNIFQIPRRGYYIPYAVIQYILNNNGELYTKEISQEFGLKDAEMSKLLKSLDRLNNILGGGLFDEVTGFSMRINPRAREYWIRIRRLINDLGRRLFAGDESEHPLYLNDGRWLGTHELNVATLFVIYELGRLIKEKSLVLVGIGKDTYVTDLYRSVIPFAKYKEIIDRDFRLPIKSDRPLLTLSSSLHPDSFRTPWRFAGYDAAFATLIKDSEEAPLKAARKVIYQEGVLVRCYYQLRSLKGTDDVEVRSPVFFYDRFQNEYDSEFRHEIDAIEGNHKVTIKPYFENKLNRYDNMILYLLSKMDNPEITEATGHNYLLFLADKDVKTTINLVRDMIMDSADSRINRIIRERRIFIVTRRFRDFRRIVERRRRR